MLLIKSFQWVGLMLLGITAFMGVSTGTAKAQTSGSIDGLLASYFKVSNDLAAQNNIKAATDAKELLVGLDGVNLGQSDNNEQKAWLKHADDIKFAAWHINNGATLTEQRDYFWMLSKYLYKVLKEDNFNRAAIFKLRNTADHTFWLAQSGDASNPYTALAQTNEAELAEVLRPVALQKVPK